jgi:hypothetical protein
LLDRGGRQALVYIRGLRLTAIYDNEWKTKNDLSRFELT